MERIKDFLLMEEEFIQRQERFKPQEEKAQVISSSALNTPKFWPVEILLVNLLNLLLQEERTKVDDIRGTPMAVGSLEEIIDDNHAIVSSSVGPEYYVPILSFVEKDLIEPGCSVLLHNKVRGW
jgi:26S proteasome regulatory subunit T2